MKSSLMIGITGGIGAGKSVVSRVLRCNGFPVYDCDSEAKKLMTNDSQIKGKLQNKLGEDVYNADGSLNKKKLSEVLFSDETVRKFVNSIVHAAVRKDIEKKRRNSGGLFFVESAILASSKLDKDCNSVWLIESDREERIKRIAKRDALCSEEICKRIESQIFEISLLKCDEIVVFINDNHHSLLSKILKKTKKNTNNQILTILC